VLRCYSLPFSFIFFSSIKKMPKKNNSSQTSQERDLTTSVVGSVIGGLILYFVFFELGNRDPPSL